VSQSSGQEHDTEADRIQDIDQLASRQDRLEGKVDQILDVLGKFTGGAPVSHGTAQGQTEDRLDRPSSVAEQVRAELAKAETARAADQAAADDKSERDQMKADLAKLKETRPEPPQPRRQRVMWGPR